MAKMLCAQVLVCTVIIFFTNTNFVSMEANEEQLVSKVFARYNKNIRPSTKFGDPTKVTFYITLLQLISVAEKLEEMTTSLYINLQWMDARLSWDPKDYNGLTSIRLPSSVIWKPDIALHNNNDAEYDATVPVNAVVNSSGIVEWLPAALFKSACHIKVDFFPFDWQNCTMRFKSFAYDRNEVLLISAYYKVVVDKQAFRENGEWDIIHCPIRINNHQSDHSYQDITLYFIIQRKSLFYIINIIIPSVLISSLSVFVFILPSASSEKMTLGMSVLLGLTVYLTLLAKRVPETSLGVPLAGSYLLFTMIVVAISIVFSVIVLNCYHWKLTTVPMPSWFFYLFMELFPRILKMKRPITKRQKLMESDEMKTCLQTAVGADEKKDKTRFKNNHRSSTTHRKYASSCFQNSLHRKARSRRESLDAASMPSLHRRRKTASSLFLDWDTLSLSDKLNSSEKETSRYCHVTAPPDRRKKIKTGENHFELETFNEAMQEIKNDVVQRKDQRNSRSSSLVNQFSSRNSQGDDINPMSVLNKARSKSNGLKNEQKHLKFVSNFKQSFQCKQIDHMPEFKYKSKQKNNNFKTTKTDVLNMTSPALCYRSTLRFNPIHSKSAEALQISEDLKEDTKLSSGKYSAIKLHNLSLKKSEMKTHISYSNTFPLSIKDHSIMLKKKSRRLETKKHKISNPLLASTLPSAKKSCSVKEDPRWSGSTSNIHKQEIKFACGAVELISQKMRRDNRNLLITEDWRFVASVIDRLLLVIFFSVFIFGVLCYGSMAVLNLPPEYPFDDKDPRYARCSATNF